MNELENKIINQLLDKFESSKHYHDLGSSPRRVYLKTKKDLPFYFKPEYFDKKQETDDIFKELEKDGYVICKRDNDHDLLEMTLVLDLNKIKELYAMIHREYKKDIEKNLVDHLHQYHSHVPWIDAFIQDAAQKIEDHVSMLRYVSTQDWTDWNKTIKVLERMSQQDQEITLRKFSIITFNDSKVLEGMKNKILNIVNDYYTETFIDDNEMFAHFNIVKNPSYMFIKGSMKLQIHDQVIDIGKIGGPFALTAENMKDMTILHIDASCLCTIENLTSFYDCVLEDTLIIYLGGYHNTLRRELLKKIKAYKPELKCYHFGDIDAGGFYIQQHLCEKTGIQFAPLAMDIQTLKKYEKYAKPLTANDRSRLKKIDSECFKEVIAYMLEHNVKLEQEIVEL